MQPGRVPRRPLGLTPFLEHRRRDTLEFVNLFLRLRIGNELQAVAIRIEEIDRLEDAVIDRADYIQPLGLDVLLRLDECVIVFYFECDVLHPARRIAVEMPRRPWSSINAC